MRPAADALQVAGREFPLLPCGCGQQGCIEGYLSGSGFCWLWQHFISRHRVHRRLSVVMMKARLTRWHTPNVIASCQPYVQAIC
nr:ROK family protein [Erwinia amylovora]